MSKVNSVNSANVVISVKKEVNKEKNNTGANKGTDLSVLNDYKKDLISFKGIEEDEVRNPLDRFILNPEMRLSPSHTGYYYINRNTARVLGRLIPIQKDWWAQSPIKSETICPWKMHIYADTEEDWAKLTATVGRYLNIRGVTWKTLNSNYPIDIINTDEKQKGKAFTVYSASQEEFKKIASDIDYIIRNNGLCKDDTNILGDRKLGDTGRIFYRFEHNSGKTKDKVYSFQNKEDMDEYHNNYDPNRQGNNYLASDMTAADDPFYDFNP